MQTKEFAFAIFCLHFKYSKAIRAVKLSQKGNKPTLKTNTHHQLMV